jgi:hypothetical protein
MQGGHGHKSSFDAFASAHSRVFIWLLDLVKLSSTGLSLSFVGDAACCRLR